MATQQCRCGYLESPSSACTRAPKCAVEYQSRISGPLFDRIDLHVEVPAISSADLALPPPAEGTREVAARIGAARTRQHERYRDVGGPERPRTNSEVDGKLLEEIAAPDQDGRNLLIAAVDRLNLSARGFHRILRVARTLADLEASPRVRRIHIAEALSFRRVSPAR
jgi:magnesium chelatase family protein